MSRDPIGAIIAYNRQFVGRYDVLLQRKAQNLAKSPFKFFRGTFHLFASDMAAATLSEPPVLLPTQGSLIVVGDIHGENYGAYKADDGSVRYDINDFDETTSTLLNFDCRRSAVGLVLAARDIGLGNDKSAAAVMKFGGAYWDRMREAAERDDFSPPEISDRHPPKATVAQKLVADAAAAKRRAFIAGLLQKDSHQLARGDKFFELKPADRQRGERLLEDYLQNLSTAKRQTLAGASLVDLCGRMAGCGSLGRYRFVALMAPADGDAEQSVLLELKESLPSACDLCAPGGSVQAVATAANPQERATGSSRVADSNRAAPNSRAAQVLDVERQMQAASNAYLGVAVDGDGSFQVRELGPHDARLEWQLVRKEHEFGDVAELHAKVLANAHARAALKQVDARQHLAGSPWDVATAKADFLADLSQFAHAYAAIVEADHAMFEHRRSEVERSWRLP